MRFQQHQSMVPDGPDWIRIRSTFLPAGVALALAVAPPGCGMPPSSGHDDTAHTYQALSGASAGGAADPVPCAAWSHAVVANTGDLMVNSGSRVDSYASSQGAYGGANVGTNAVGLAATRLTDNGAVIEGILRSNAPAGLSVVAVPAQATNLPLGAASPGALNINNASDDLTLAPGNYVASDLNVNFPGAIHISPTGQVRIWITGNLNLGGNENQNGVPRNLAFLVTSSGTVNLNSGGALYGMVYAPTSGINVNSPVFGSVIGRTVTLNSGGAVHVDLNSACDPTTTGGGGGGTVLASSPPRALPLPPKTQGCFQGTANGWVPIPCTPSSVAVPAQALIDFDQITTPNGGSAVAPFQFAQVEATFTAFGSETNVRPVDGKMTSSSFTLQGNTSTFFGTGGDEDWVQFVVASSGGQNSIEIQSWDITTFEKTKTKPNCVSPNPCSIDCGCSTVIAGLGTPQSIPTRSDGIRALDFATVAGSVYKDNNGTPVIGMVAQISWYEPGNDPLNNRGLYAIVTADQFDLAHHWEGFSGTFIGNGDSSEARFTDSSVLTRTLAGTCNNETIFTGAGDIPWPGTCAGAQALLPDTTVSEQSPTAEGNNLCRVGSSTSLVAADSNLVSTQYLASTSCSPPSCIATTSQIFVRSNDEDTGVRPINLNGVPFWESPDIIFVPTGEAATVDTVSSLSVLTPGVTYDAYVRVHNDFGCNDIGGVQARVFLADPQALSTPWPDGEITSGAYATGKDQPAGGITVKAGGPGLLGPFTFKAPSSGFGNGHRCALADVISATQRAPDAPFDPLSSPQVAQRNLQFEECAYALTNASTHDGNLQLTLSVTTPGSPTLPVVPSLGSDGVSASITFDDPNGTWAAVWSKQSGAGSQFSVTTSGSGASETTTVRLGQLTVKLDPVTLANGQSHIATANLTNLPTSTTVDLNLAAVLTDAKTDARLVANGGSCEQTGEGPVK